MVTTQIVLGWLQRSTPIGLELMTTLLLLYFCHPMMQAFPGLSAVYSYAVYATSSRLRMPGASLWVKAGLCSLFWVAEVDPVSSELGRLGATHSMTQAVLGSLRPQIATDPVLAGMSVVVAMGILLQAPDPGQ